MATTALTTLKARVVRGWKPLASQLTDWLDSFWHKGDAIPIGSITGLTDVLNQFTTQAYVDTRINPDVVEGSNVVQYDVPAGVMLRLVTLRLPQAAVIRIGYAPFADDVMPDVDVPAGKPTPIQLNLEDDVSFRIFISGLPQGCSLKFYKF